MISGVVDLGRDNDARLLRLRAALSLGTGFQLVIVEVEPGPIRKEVLRRVQTWSLDASIGELALVPLDPDATLAAQLDRKSGAIVTGLELPSFGEASASDWIAELNWSRDALPGLVPGPLLLVVSQAIHHVLFERASDLYSWRRHTTRVAVTARELAFPLWSPYDVYWLEQRERISSILSEVVVSVVWRTPLMLNLASILLELGDEGGATQTLDEIVSLADNPPDGEDEEHVSALVKLMRAECALRRLDFAAAGAILDDVAPEARVDMPGGLALLRGKLLTARGAWDEAVVELARAVSAAGTWAPLLLARAREALSQTALASGDVVRARHEIATLTDVARAHMAEWGIGMMIRIAEIAGDVYPDESAPLLDAAFVAAESSSRREAMITIQCLRAKRAWLLDRAEPARAALAQAKRWIRPDDPAGLHAALLFCEAVVALAEHSNLEDRVVPLLARARELFRIAAPRKAAVAGRLLGELWIHMGRPERAVIAYQGAAEDAQRAGHVELVAQAELGELGVAVEGGIEQDDAVERLRVLSERFRAAEHAQHEGVARAHLGRCLLRRGLRDLAVVELERARACFADTTDAVNEASVVGALDAAR